MREFLPRPLVRALRSLGVARGARFSEAYPSWEAAAEAAAGYGDPAILARVREAALAVKRGEAAFERDSVRFAKPDPDDPQLPPIRRAAEARGGKLEVLDFGGSLGSAYFRCRPHLDGVALRWRVVEQPSFAECGRAEFESDELRFYESVEAAAADATPDMALLSSVLQYLPHPDAVARRIAHAAPALIVLDRTPVHDRAEDAIVVQHVPPSIYRASYPFRIFGRDRLPALFGPAYAVTEWLPDTPFEALESQCGARYAGMVLERIAAPESNA